VPVELLGNQEFPRVTERPYFLSLAAHSFYWFRLDRPAEAVTVLGGSAEDAPGTTRPLPGAE
jgi:maltose alpha-D-glucosyltransferase/alpha-amylase